MVCFKSVTSRSSKHSSSYYHGNRYVGDGENDLCPGENVLTHRDNLYVRRGNYQMCNLLREDPARRRSIKARVVFWENGDDITQDLMLSK